MSAVVDRCACKVLFVSLLLFSSPTPEVVVEYDDDKVRFHYFRWSERHRQFVIVPGWTYLIF